MGARATYMVSGAHSHPVAQTAHMHGGPWLRTSRNVRTLFNLGAFTRSVVLSLE
jgi:hypothetical protein